MVILMTSDPTKVGGDFPVRFRYTAGLAGEKFLREIKDNAQLMAARCPSCDLNYLPPRIYCERCMASLNEYVRVENAGIVESYTRCTRDNRGEQLVQPVHVVLVRFPSTYGGLVHRTNGKVAIGDRVRAVFKEKSERTGSILDIAYFEKIQ
jgi:uncharacterized OB-fold protein